MAKKNINIKDETDAVSEPIADYGTAITIPVSVPTMGGYTVESLRQELTEYALKLVKRAEKNETKQPKVDWRNLKISDNVMTMSLGKCGLSADSRSDKEILADFKSEKFL